MRKIGKIVGIHLLITIIYCTCICRVSHPNCDVLSSTPCRQLHFVIVVFFVGFFFSKLKEYLLSTFCKEHLLSILTVVIGHIVVCCSSDVKSILLVTLS